MCNMCNECHFALLGKTAKGISFSICLCRHAKLSQCFFFWGGKTFEGKSLHTRVCIWVGSFSYFRVSFPKKGRPLLGRSPHQGVRGCVIIGHRSAFDGYSIKINPMTKIWKVQRPLSLYTYTQAQSKPKGNFSNQNHSDIDLWYILKMPLNYIWLSQLIGDIHFSATCLQWILAKSKQSK